MYIIGDGHGKAKELEKLLKKLNSEEETFFVGDLMDRGEYSKDIILMIINNKNMYSVLGNHEIMLIHNNTINRVKKNMYIDKVFDANGGYATMKSFNYNYNSDEELFKFDTKEDEKVFFDCVEYIKSLPLVIKINNILDKPLYISHSTLLSKYEKELYNEELFIRKIENNKEFFYIKNLEMLLDKIIEEDSNIYENILWNRIFYYNGLYYDNPNYYNIFGHTPTMYLLGVDNFNKSKNKIYVNNNYIGIDTGAAKKQYICAVRVDKNIKDLEVYLEKIV